MKNPPLENRRVNGRKFSSTSPLGTTGALGISLTPFFSTSVKYRMSSQKLFTSSEVAKHNSPEDLWFVLHGKVYDITKFLKEHPGGEEVLINLAGADATQCFDDIGHSQEAKQLKDTYEIGTLDGTMAASGTSSKGNGTTLEDDDDWEYVEHKEKSSPYLPLFIGFGVLVYAVLFYYIYY